MAPVVWLAGCFRPDLPGAIGCADGEECPGSLVCTERLVCEDPAQLTDGSVPVSDAGGATPDGGIEPDARPDEDLAWRLIALAREPSPRFGHAMTSDPSGEGVFMFGGIIPAGEGLTGRTWRFDGESWHELAADAGDDEAPGSRFQHAMASHVSRDVVVLFGGFSELEELDDHWEWDGNEWSLPGLSGDSPSGRQGHAMAFGGNAVVMFGGFDGEALDDSWEWDGQDWHESLGTTRPQARAGHAMAYDASRRRVVLFGGASGIDELFADTWEWDGESWELLPVEAPIPPARRYHAMAYDAARSEVLLFGGEGASGETLADVWAWNGEAWAEVTPRGVTPGPRYQHAMAYDPALGRVVLFGGHDGILPQGDTWVLEPTR
jgi:hypothetical protein